MPNHCHNRVTFYASPKHNDQIAKIKQMFLDENIFGQIIPEPDWANQPLMSKDIKGIVYDRGKVGELPIDGKFPSTGRVAVSYTHLTLPTKRIV